MNTELEPGTPLVIENRDFVALEEEDIQKLNRQEAAKFERNPDMAAIMSDVAADADPEGRWEEHWVTVDASGRRVYARVYRSPVHTVAVAADGRIVRETVLPRREVPREDAGKEAGNQP